MLAAAGLVFASRRFRPVGPAWILALCGVPLVLGLSGKNVAGGTAGERPKLLDVHAPERPSPKPQGRSQSL